MDRHNAELNAYMARIDANSKLQQKLDQLIEQRREELLTEPAFNPLKYSNFAEAFDELGQCQLSDDLESAIKTQDATKIGELLLKNAWRYWGKQAEEVAELELDQMGDRR